MSLPKERKGGKRKDKEYHHGILNENELTESVNSIDDDSRFWDI